MSNPFFGGRQSAPSQIATPRANVGSSIQRMIQKSMSNQEPTPEMEPLVAPEATYKRPALLDAIAGGESFEKNEGYTTINQGTANGKIVGASDSAKHILRDKDLTDLTLRELMEFQALERGNENRIFAAGRYQFIPETTEYAIDRAGLSLDDKFSPENQDKMAMTLAMKKRPALGAYLRGESDDIDAAMLGLAKEWASFPVPSGDKKGQSYYGGANKASHGVKETQQMLIDARKNMQ